MKRLDGHRAIVLFAVSLGLLSSSATLADTTFVITQGFNGIANGGLRAIMANTAGKKLGLKR